MGSLRRIRSVLLITALVATAVGTAAIVYASPDSVPAPAPSPAPTPTPASVSESALTLSPEPVPETTPVLTPRPAPEFTLVVAAHDSPDAGTADFTADGIDDQVEIQAAIDALEAREGGKVLLLEGNYYLSSEGDYAVTLVGNLTLEGQGNVRLQLVGDPAKGMFATKDWVWNPPFVKIDNVTLRNLTIDVGSPQGFLREWPEGVFWQDFFVMAGSVNNLRLENSTFIQHNPESVVARLFLWQSDHVRIINDTFEGVVIWVFSHTRAADPASITGGDTLIQGNVFINTSRNMAIGGNMNGLTVTDNEFFNCGGTAIDVGISPGAVVERNRIYGAKGVGIYSEGGHDVTIRDNIIDGIAADSRGGWNGFGIATIDNLHMRLGGNVLIEDNFITNSGNGIGSMGVPDVTIRNNDISGIGRHGILLGYMAEGGLNYKGTPSYADNGEVLNNRIVDFGRDYEWGRGVMLTNVQYTEVIGNFIDGRDNPGAVEGVGEYHDSYPDVPDKRPDGNNIESNTVTGVARGIVVLGQNTVVQ